MKKLILLSVLFSCFMVGNAQPPIRPNQFRNMPPPPPGMDDRRHGKMGEEKRAKIEMYKIQFMTEKLALTSAEAQAFWPVYNDHKKAVKAIIDAKIEDEIQFQEAMLTAKKKYKADLKPILKSDERINDALSIERAFLRTMRDEMMRRRGFKS